MDEVSVIPPLNLSVSTVTTLPVSGVTTTSTATRTFSGRRLLTNTSVSQPQGTTTVTTYTAWDSADRPTTATAASGGQSSTQSFAYDTATRTQTSTQSGVTCSQTFDQNGNPLVGTCPGSMSTFTTLTTQQICR